ncbi:MAG: TraR/DksA C4-type zinc finger protein [Planctomycetes bacterium]|nr:TraR/DksA C4-type zinc finger protein [Planctomycetota bacterium]
MSDNRFADHPDLERCIEFHGHFCPGLTTGYRAARIGMSRLGAARSEDEELIAIVENDACGIDAIQVLTGCTFGKGNLIYRDYGKHVYTFALRPSGRAVRISRRTAAPSRDGRQEMSRDETIQHMLTAPDEELFEIRELTIDLPSTARIRQSVTCDACGEAVMETRTRTVNGRTLCIPCAEPR